MSDQIDGSTSAMLPPPDAQVAQIVERAQAGDRKASSSFLEIFEKPLFRYIRNQVGNDEVAKDLYSEVAEKVCRALPKTDERLRYPLAVNVIT